MSMRRLRMGLKTLFGIQKQGFFIPYRYADSLPAAEARKPYAAIDVFMRRHEPGFSDVLQKLGMFKEEFASFGQTPPPDPRWSQDWFPRLDGAVAYAMVRELKPKRIVEVGSGHSTRFMARAIKDGALATEFTAIDPAPRARIESLPVRFIRKTLHQAPSAPFAALEKGDILFIDSSHIAMPGTDVDQLLLDVLPSLPDGVIVHIHDIFLPDDYPVCWDWRGYNEQQAVAPMFLGGGYELLFSSAYVASRMKDELDRSVIGGIQLPEGAFETSLWLRKQKITDI